MTKRTAGDLVGWIVISVIVISLYVGGIPKTVFTAINEFFFGAESIEYTVYTDMLPDIVNGVVLSGLETCEDGKKHNVDFALNINKDVMDSNLPIFVNNYKEYESLYKNKELIGYYSLAFIGDYDLVSSLSQEIKNKSNCNAYIVNFGELLDGFMENKTYKEVCNGPDIPIKIKAVYNSKDDIFYRLFESQILYELTGNDLQSEENFVENREAIDKIIDKVEKYTGTFETDAIYVVCEQSPVFLQLTHQGQPCYEYSMACEPFYVMYNDSKWEESIETLKNKVRNDSGLRSVTDSAHSKAIKGSQYRNVYALDSVLKVLRSE